MINVIRRPLAQALFGLELSTCTNAAVVLELIALSEKEPNIADITPSW